MRQYCIHKISYVQLSLQNKLQVCYFSVYLHPNVKPNHCTELWKTGPSKEVSRCWRERSWPQLSLCLWSRHGGTHQPQRAEATAAQLPTRTQFLTTQLLPEAPVSLCRVAQLRGKPQPVNTGAIQHDTHRWHAQREVSRISHKKKTSTCNEKQLKKI